MIAPFYKQTGFTLIELMISMVLGLLIIAAVTQVYIMNIKTKSTQQSGSEIIDTSIFAIQDLEKRLRIANLGNPVTLITDQTPNGGVVLTAQNIGLAQFNNPSYLTATAGEAAGSAQNGWTAISNMNIGSDQLTIQYRNVTGEDMLDCEGSTLANGETAIERYYVRANGTGGTKGTRDLALACDAGRLDTTGILAFANSDNRNFGTAGQNLIDNVDQFKILLGIQRKNGNTDQITYVTSQDYKEIVKNIPNEAQKPKIVAIKYGVISHGTSPVLDSTDTTDFNLIGQNQRLDAGSSRAKRVRRAYEGNVILRNARMITVKPIRTKTP